MPLRINTAWFTALALFLVPAVLYYCTTGFDFIYTWDDQVYVVSNAAIRGLSLDNWRSIFSSTYVSSYYPVQILSYALDYSIWGMDPYGFHLSNVILHALNVVLAYHVVVKLTGNSRASLVVALIFGVHPVNVEVVAWVSQRKTLLATFFFLCSLLLYLRWRAVGSIKSYSMSLVSFVLAVFSKATVVAYPLILLAREKVDGSLDKRRMMALSPYLAVSVLGAVAAISASLSSTAIDRNTMNAEVLFGLIYPTMFPVYLRQLLLLVWPIGLCAFYDAAIHRSFFDLPVLASIAFWTVTIIAIAKYGDKQQRFWSFWVLVCLLPTSNIIPIQVFYADRFLYLPQIGCYVLIGTMASKIVEDRWKRHRLRSVLPVISITLMVTVTVALMWLSFERMEVWRNEIALWEDTVSKSPRLHNPRANLGVAYERAGRLAEAARQYEEALKRYPDPGTRRRLLKIKERLDLGRPR